MEDSTNEMIQAGQRAGITTRDRTLDDVFSQVDLNQGVEASASVALLQVATFTRGQQKAVEIVDRIAEEAMSSVDRKVDGMLLQRYETELHGLLSKAEQLLRNDPKDVALADFITVKRDLRRARENVTQQLRIVDPTVSSDEIDEFFADVDEIINMKRPAGLKATHINYCGVWIRPNDDARRDKVEQARKRRKSKAN